MEGDLSGRLIVAAPDAFAATAAAFLAEALRQRGIARPAGTVSLALSGGSTPGPAYARLARTSDVPWASVEVYFADERGVPPDDPRSNYRLVREELLEPAGIPEDRVHRMEVERPDREAAAAEYAAALPPRLDLLVLGIGEDGHTASLFPDSPALDREEEAGARPAGPVAPGESPAGTGPDPAEPRVLVVEAPEGQDPRPRMTVSPDVIREARQIVVLVSGERKAEAVRRAMEEDGPAREVPARLALEGSWILDRAAASGLGAGS